MGDIENIKSFLTEICSLSGISGHEAPVCDAIVNQWTRSADEVRVSKIGNVYALKKGRAKANGEPNKKILLAVHMDGIGMIVHSLAGEFIRFAPIGGFDPRILPGQMVTIHTKNGTIPGMIIQPAGHLLPHAAESKPVPMDKLMIDTGLDAETVKSKIEVGDIISYAFAPTELPTNCIAAHTLDNRASVAAVDVCLNALKRFNHCWDVYACATVQEETRFLGGYSAAFDIRPDIAIAIDVCQAKGPGASGWRTVKMESGPSLGYGPNIHPALFKAFKTLCETLEMPFTSGANPGSSGTDAHPMQITASGHPTMVVSIPLRYMHTPVEVVSLKDIARTGRLLAEFIARTDEDFLQKLNWED